MYNGIINVLKPTGLTSSDVIVRLKKIYGFKKIGHMGTLDPMGAGVLIAGVGKAARLFDYFLNKDKEYYATFKFGLETDTLDSSGKIINTTDVIPSEYAINEIIKTMTGVTDQLPPKYSAKNINGVRAYDLARRGEDFELSTKRVEIKKIIPAGKKAEDTYGFNILCSGGTYIRSICRDLAYKLNSLAVMTSIIRTKCGKFTIEDSLTLEEIEKNRDVLIEPQYVIDLPEIVLPEDSLKKISNGVAVSISEPDGQYKVYCSSIFLGIGESVQNGLKMKIWMANNEDN